VALRHFIVSSAIYLEPVFRLVAVYNPFLVAFLIIFKTIAPYMILAACLIFLNRLLGMPPHTLFILVLCIADVMTITFFLKVDDTASWFVIGQSLASFSINSLLLVWTIGAYLVGYLLLGETDSSHGISKIE